MFKIFVASLLHEAVGVSCIVCSSVREESVKSFSGSVASIGSKGDCWRQPKAANFRSEECALGCYSLYYAMQIEDTDKGKIEKRVVERGCQFDIDGEAGVRFRFPSDGTCAGMCKVALREKNYGNYGTINAIFDTSSSATGNSYPYGSLEWSAAGPLRCHQCSTHGRVESSADISCLRPEGSGSTCPSVNATSCYETTALFNVTDEFGEKNEYAFAERGCSSAKSNSLTDSIFSKSHELFNDTERELTTHFCNGNGCNSAFPEEVLDLDSSASSLNNFGMLSAFILLQNAL
ncbi:Oidioi.mRNA.OKI2018_I69.XSR.g15336.t1.cds [Oikopleura dioica]|uniref:Oidioi.mRNA.OKI2018_I69.XSR.g15336.t1.cds n=1 Tax=Oikopleura dioica TaxID=34765 RepID=A0ABN7SCJ2_OIKDI|nr:Oidioi.mRNA.OKI2018_I69.XSR.g15336.t1.cds [Oikopleura dioica]